MMMCIRLPSLTDALKKTQRRLSTACTNITVAVASLGETSTNVYTMMGCVLGDLVLRQFAVLCVSSLLTLCCILTGFTRKGRRKCEGEG